MIEKILFAPNVSGTEFLRTLAKWGVDTFGLRVMGAKDLAILALTRSGMSAGRLISRSEEENTLFRLTEGIGYFEAASREDGKRIASALRSVRMFAGDDEIAAAFAESDFTERCGALTELLRRYKAELAADSKTDEIGLIRAAADGAEPIGCEVMYLKESRLKPLERRLADRVSGGKAEEVSLFDLFRREAGEAAFTNITRAASPSCEVENILAYIRDNNIPLDKCLIAAADTNVYAPLFREYCAMLGLPVTFTCGLSLGAGNGGKVLKHYGYWCTYGYFGTDALRNMVCCEGFDRAKLLETIGADEETLPEIIESAGSLALRDNAEKNRERLERCGGSEVLIRLGAELALPVKEFIEKYTLIREEEAEKRLDEESVKAILRFDGNPAHSAKSLIDGSICRQVSAPGCLCVCSVESALSSVREYLFVCGLDADFPGSPTENYLIGDAEYRLVSGDESLPTSDNRIKFRRDGFYTLLSLASSLGAEVRLSYADFDPAELKARSKSSVLFDLEGGVDCETYAGFYDRNIFPADTAARHYGKTGKPYLTDALFSDSPAPVDLSGRPFSPTAVETFFECPRKFYIQRVLHIDEIEEDDPFEVADNKTIGTLVHRAMEFLNTNPDKDSFMANAEEIFDRFLRSRPPQSKSRGEAVKKEFMAAAEKGFDKYPNVENVLTEKVVNAKIMDMNFKGKIDRLERNDEGKYVLVDYKTGASIRHNDRDVDTCVQILLYAYMLEKMGIDVKTCEYRYLRYGSKVVCSWHDKVKTELRKKLDEFKAALETGEFKCSGDERACMFCDFGMVCGKVKGDENE
ncbi:MAG: PD-(D/E)XK nuclease family protein [Abditibacteriota bacterium]|nr:PD-(D/E)XK nuclease family protein [Abditibacteriota bacterium]